MRKSSQIELFREEVAGVNFLIQLMKLSLSHMDLRYNKFFEFIVSRVVPRINFRPLRIEVFFICIDKASLG